MIIYEYPIRYIYSVLYSQYPAQGPSTDVQDVLVIYPRNIS